MKKILYFAILGIFFAGCGENHQDSRAFITVTNEKGPTLGYSPGSGVKILIQDGLKFKDLNKNGRLDPYEDWRLSAEERSKALAAAMSVEEIAGLMLYSSHQSIPSPAPTAYNGKSLAESGLDSWELTDEQKSFLQHDNVRHILVTGVESPEVAARWNNEMQAFIEGIGWGIPGNNSSDPRHSAQVSDNDKAEFNEGAGGKISLWPDGLAIAATFDPSLVKRFGEIASREYRALGISTTLSPQIDLATEPRWFRTPMTFGESPDLATDMGRAYVDGFQTSTGEAEIADGWGYHSVNAMAKHWPGGGTGEAGRDGHWAFGKFAVYPGNNFETHLKPFTEGAFKLEGKTQMASAVMPYYTISVDQAKDGTNYANGYSKYIITDLLREKYGYEGVVCTDWGITKDEDKTPDIFAGKPWGAEELTVAERHYMILMAGVDQFGGNNEIGPIIEAYHIGVKEYGEEFMRKRFEESAVRLLRNIFRLGLFENPYLDPEESVRLVGNPEFMKEGYDAQLKSIVLLKNKENILPIRERKKVYVPKNHIPAVKSWFGGASEVKEGYLVSPELIDKYYDFTDNPSEADFAIVFVKSPYTHSDGGGYDIEDRLQGGNGYIPISLQYRPYTATDARVKSLAAGDPVIDPEIKDRTYRGKQATAANTMDLDTILMTKQRMGEKPVIVVTNITRPMVFHEFEPYVDAIVARFSVSGQATLDIISGKYEPSGLLPIQMPASMAAIEKQWEDIPFDVVCHKDTEGNRYDFGYGLNWKGIIQDNRTAKYGLNK